MIAQALNPDNYAVTIHASASLLVDAAIAVLGSYVLIREHGSRTGVMFWLFTVCISVWLSASAAIYASLHEPQAFFWMKIAQMGVSFIPATILALAFTVVQRENEFRWFIRISVAVSVLFCLGVAFTDLHIRGVYHYSWGYYPQYGPLSVFFIAYFFGIMVYVLRLYWLEYKGSTNERRRKRLKGLLLAFGIGYFASADFLAAFGVPLFPFGFVLVLFFLSLAAYVIVRYRLIDITPELAAGHVLEIMKGGVIVVDPGGKVRVVNRAALIILGRQKSEILDRDLSSIIDLPLDLKDEHRLSKGKILDYEMDWNDKSGRQIPISVSVSPIMERDGSLVGIVYVAYDITERKKTEQRPV